MISPESQDFGFEPAGPIARRLLLAIADGLPVHERAEALEVLALHGIGLETDLMTATVSCERFRP